MTVELYEMARPQVQTGKQGSARVMWFARGSDYEPEVRAAALARIPGVYENTLLTLQNLGLQHLGATVFHITANYGTGEQTAPGGGGGGGGGETNGGDQLGPHVRMSFGTRTQHVTQSLYHVGSVQRIKDDRLVTNHKGAIGISKTGVEGCDTLVPNTTWSETWIFNPRFVTWDFADTLENLAGRVNLVTFRNRPSGEVMFLGAELHNEDQDRTPITFNFFAEKNIAAFQLTNEFMPIDKEGHEYLWVEYEDSVDNKNPLRVARAVHVEIVGRPGGVEYNGHPSNKEDFDQLRIGN